jgi:RNA polymerase sigma factor (sigma-70 family)
MCRFDPVDLFHRCASDRDDSEAWSELLRRYAAKIKYFIRGTLLRDQGSADCGYSTTRADVQENDLFQNTILRLVENDCAVMKRFSGSQEQELLAYLAVISRSVVRDTLRSQAAVKRHPGTRLDVAISRTAASSEPTRRWGSERHVLIGEVMGLTEQTIRSFSGEESSRDRLVFELHFVQGLSFQQISECRGIHLSKAGVEKLVNRLVDRVRSLATTGKSEATF